MRHAIPVPNIAGIENFQALYYDGPERDEFTLVRHGQEHTITSAQCEDALGGSDSMEAYMARYLLNARPFGYTAPKNQPRRNTLLIMMEEQK